MMEKIKDKSRTLVLSFCVMKVYYYKLYKGGNFIR